MAGYHVAVTPVGKVDAKEVEAALIRAAKILRAPMELRKTVAVPRGSEDVERGQHRAATMIGLLRTAVLQVGPGRMIGGDDPDDPAPLKADAYLFVTDQDLFTAKTDGVFAALVSVKHAAVISVRRIREAFYRRPADPTKQRSRLVKELLRMAGRLHGMAECPSPDCVLAPTKSPADLDAKSEIYCRACAQRLFEGKIRI